MTRNRALAGALTLLGVVLLGASATILSNHYLGHGRAGRTLSSAPLPPSLAPAPAATTTTAASAPADAPHRQGLPAKHTAPAPTASATPKPVVTPPKVVPDKPGIPVQLVVASHHLRAPVSANHLNADGSLYVPPDPRAVSWASQDAAPGSTQGTIILVGHINYGGVAGAFSDLGAYRVGQTITLVLADGRKMNYRVAAEPLEVNKAKLGPRRQEFFDQTHSFGLAGRPKSGRLLLLSCGGAFDNRTGHYESNILVYALPT